ncbi:ABC transporter ATP-binding protein [Schleiferilactobacillus harbinensis]|uniref:ABC transporter ATP-binding protein n=1 Tax=Schleiferilactobacillus harbinensis TaxID=304207 RepID=UPI0021A43E8B|nr:ABC transporter ATP-binding protein [Schleiferilactobacillus harbinensis]MCT2907366.1 ABC transporter ATP-binding protein [Schleiferilactobacillus harbinensis]
MVIKLAHLSKHYGDTPVLEDIDATIEEGEFYVLVGPSGSGKSTILRIIAGLIPASGGDIYFNDKKVTEAAPKDRHLAMVFQNYALLPFMSVAETIRFGLHNLHLSEAEENDRVADALKMVHLTELADRKPKELSGGQQQRVAVARAIATKANLVLMDEPLSNLDAQLRNEMREELVELHKELKMTLIYVTHDQTEAMTMGERIMVLNDHKVQQVGTPLDLYNHPRNEFVATFIGSPKMNMFTVAVDELGKTATLVITDEDQRPAVIPLPEPLPAGTYRLGVRPEKIKLSLTSTSAYDVPVQVVNVASLGRASNVTLRNHDIDFIADVAEQFPEDAQATFVTFPTEAADLHFFAPDTGLAIASPEEKAGVSHGVA